MSCKSGISRRRPDSNWCLSAGRFVHVRTPERTEVRHGSTAFLILLWPPALPPLALIAWQAATG